MAAALAVWVAAARLFLKIRLDFVARVLCYNVYAAELFGVCSGSLTI